MELVWFGLAVLVACAKLIIVYCFMLIGTIFGWVASTFLFLFEAWVFQAVFGAWVVFALQQLHQASVEKTERFQKRYDQKLAAIQAYFALVDRRIYATRAYRAALISNEPHTTWTAERERYRDSVREWNERAPGILVTLLTLLPAKLCFQLERETFPRFAMLDAYLGRIRRARERGQSDDPSVVAVASLLAELSELSGASLAEFLGLARREARLIDKKPAITLENEHDLSLGYLITSLFKPAVD